MKPIINMKEESLNLYNPREMKIRQGKKNSENRSMVVCLSKISSHTRNNQMFMDILMVR